MNEDHWSVTVRRNGEDVVTIESNCLSGREISAADEKAICTAAHHLLAFIGHHHGVPNELIDWAAKFAAEQRPLGHEFSKVLAEGIADGSLYVKS